MTEEEYYKECSGWCPTCPINNTCKYTTWNK